MALINIENLVIKEVPEELIHSIIKKLNKIMATQAELAASIAAITAKVTKIGTESTATLAKVQELQDVIDNLPTGTVTPELQAAVDALAAQVQIVDDLIADAPAPTEG